MKSVQIKRFTLNNTAFLIVLFLTLVCNAYGHQKVSIEGRVVDENGKPLSNMRVSLIIPPCKQCLDQLIPGLVTVEEGLFYFETDNLPGQNEARIFIEELVPEGFFDPIYAPDLTLSHIDKYKGIVVNISNPGTIKIGDVVPTISYVSFSVDLSTYFPDMSGEYSDVKLTIKDMDKKAVAENRSVRNKYWQNDSTVRLALPKGEWWLYLDFPDEEKANHNQVIHLNLRSQNCVLLKTLQRL